MNNILTEKEYQKFILDILEKQNGYRIRENVKYDRLLAMDKEMLFEHLRKCFLTNDTLVEKYWNVLIKEVNSSVSKS